MFNQNKKQSGILEQFRIKAHLRSYVKDPIVINEKLMVEAVIKLKKLPYESNDPSDSVAVEFVLDSYRLGYFKYEDLTDEGCELVRQGKHRRTLQQAGERVHHKPILRNGFGLKAI